MKGESTEGLRDKDVGGARREKSHVRERSSWRDEGR